MNDPREAEYAAEENAEERGAVGLDLVAAVLVGDGDTDIARRGDV